MKNKKRIVSVLLAVLIVILLALLGGILYQYFHVSRELKETKMGKEYQNESREVEREPLIQTSEQQADAETDTTADTEETADTVPMETEPVQEAPAPEANFLEGLTASQPGDILESSQINMENLPLYFTAEEISEEILGRINGKSYRDNPNIGLDQLRYLKMLHYNFEHQIQVGEMIVNAQIAEDVLGVFRELFQNEYEIQSMYLIDNYWTGNGGDTDFASIEVNNTSCFNYREVTGGSSLSNHAYGCAIDINPQQNPYVIYDNGAPSQWSHSNADEFIDRESGKAHVITHEDLCYEIFSNYGFTWGGDWENPKDFQHFEKPVV